MAGEGSGRVLLVIEGDMRRMRSLDVVSGRSAGPDPDRPVDVQARVRSRLRRSRVWLSVVQFVHGSPFVFVVLAVIDGSIPAIGAAVAAALAVGSLVVFAWWERRAPSSGRPAMWPRRGLGVVLPHAVAFGIAAGARTELIPGPPWSQVLLFACAVLVVEGGAICLASGVLRFPLTPELGEMDVEVLVKIRSDAEWQPEWASHEDVRLTGDALIITVRPNLKWMYVVRIDLLDVTGVVVRPTKSSDGPWFLVDGRRFWPPGGDAVAIVHRSGSTLLPVHRAKGFADVVRARIQKLKADASGTDRS
jgi:hypothetical protein